mmetsp:Transcript_34064/g.79401  ORF Transcript_34064/g.79401 Transcript_34064/m.79401 type:complete len:269 (-) Transcript_34064:51-857(-)
MLRLRLSVVIVLVFLQLRLRCFHASTVQLQQRCAADTAGRWRWRRWLLGSRRPQADFVLHEDTRDLTGAVGDGDLISGLVWHHQRAVDIDVFGDQRGPAPVAAVVEAGLRAAHDGRQHQMPTPCVEHHLELLRGGRTHRNLAIVGALVMYHAIFAVQRDELTPQLHREGAMLDGILGGVHTEASQRAGAKGGQEPPRPQRTAEPRGRARLLGEGALHHMDEERKRTSQDGTLNFAARCRGGEGIHPGRGENTEERSSKWKVAGIYRPT